MVNEQPVALATVWWQVWHIKAVRSHYCRENPFTSAKCISLSTTTLKLLPPPTTPPLTFHPSQPLLTSERSRHIVLVSILTSSMGNCRIESQQLFIVHSLLRIAPCLTDKFTDVSEEFISFRVGSKESDFRFSRNVG